MLSGSHETNCLHDLWKSILRWFTNTWQWQLLFSLIQLPQSGCCIISVLSVCLYDDNFRKPWCTKFIFAHPLYLPAIRVKFHMKVTGSRSSHSSRKGRKLQSAITLALSHIQPCRLHVVWGFWATVYKTVRPMLSVHCLSCLSVCPVLSVSLWRSCTVAKRLDGSRLNLACR